MWCMGGPKCGRTQAGAESDFITLFNRIVIAGISPQIL